MSNRQASIRTENSRRFPPHFGMYNSCCTNEIRTRPVLEDYGGRWAKLADGLAGYLTEPLFWPAQLHGLVWYKPS